MKKNISVAQETSPLTSLWPFSLAGGVGSWYKHAFLVKVGSFWYRSGAVVVVVVVVVKKTYKRHVYQKNVG